MAWVVAIGLGTVILFMWTGFAQNVLPWGVKSVRSHGKDDGQPVITPSLPDGMTFTTAGKAAFIAARPAAYYDPKRYLALELATQAVAAIALTVLLGAFPALGLVGRLGLVSAVWLVGFASIDLQYWNWWGFTARYTLGIAFNRWVGYALAAPVIGWALGLA